MHLTNQRSSWNLSSLHRKASIVIYRVSAHQKKLHRIFDIYTRKYVRDVSRLN